MVHTPSNIVLIGMPGSGKSTVGVILAKMASLDFVDTDILIQRAAGKSLQEIVDADGYLVLRRIEEEVLLKLDCRDHVIATGGSAVYSPAAISHLKKDGVIVFLDVDIETLQSRIRNYETRGLAKRPDQDTGRVVCRTIGSIPRVCGHYNKRSRHYPRRGLLRNT